MSTTKHARQVAARGLLLSVCATAAVMTFLSNSTATAADPPRTPVGCRAAEGAKASFSGYADRIVHEKTGIEMILVPSGTFAMQPADRARPVTIRRPFYVGKTEVTNAQYRRFVAATGYDGQADTDPEKDLYLRHWRGRSILSGENDYPVVWVSWKNAKAFCTWAGLALPSEADWEYACRAGTTTPYYFGEDQTQFDRYGWANTSNEDHTHPVAGKLPNPWGLYDMLGNVHEWVEDDYVDSDSIENVAGSPTDGAPFLDGRSTKVLRGGSWGVGTVACRSTSRYNTAPVNAGPEYGFRVTLPLNDPYRVIFNCDGYSVFVKANGSVDAWIQNIFGPLEGSHVDALFWCDGAGGNTANYDSAVIERTGARIGKLDSDLNRWIEAGDDPPRIVVREAHKRGLDVFFSLRMNDIHDGHLPGEFATFKKQHPEWILGQGTIDASKDSHAVKANVQDEIYFPGYATSLNFARPEVRELKLRLIQEVFEKYDFDGLEIDLMRFPRYFPAYLEYRSAVVLTDFLRTVRQRLDERGQQRGRPVTLAMRAGENLVACQLDGFDIATWINEGLIDILIVGDSAFPAGRDIRDFKKLAQGKPVHIYACNGCIQKSFRNARGESPEVRRGLAANFWRQGADGIYTFNWFPHEQALAYQAPLLREIGDPGVLATKDKIYSAECSEYGPGAKYTHPSSPRMHNWMFAPLPVALNPVWNANSYTLIDVEVADDFDRATAEKVKALELWVQFKNLLPGDVIDFRLNGQTVGPVPELEDGKLFRFSLRPDQLRTGINQVGVRLNERSADSVDDIILTTVELLVDYE